MKELTFRNGEIHDADKDSADDHPDDDVEVAGEGTADE